MAGAPPIKLHKLIQLGLNPMLRPLTARKSVGVGTVNLLDWGRDGAIAPPGSTAGPCSNAQHNATPKPFRWTKSASDTLAGIERFCHRVTCETQTT